VFSFDGEERNSDYHNCINWRLFSLLLHPSPDREDFLVAELQECGTAGLAEEADGLRAFFEASQDAEGLARRFAEFSPELRPESPTDWEQLTRDAWPPLCVGERFYLVAPCAIPRRSSACKPSSATSSPVRACWMSARDREFCRTPRD
jgi:hypothetical protein